MSRTTISNTEGSTACNIIIPRTTTMTSSVFSSLTGGEDILSSVALNHGIEPHALLIPLFLKLDHGAVKNHRAHHKHRGRKKHRRYKSMDVVPTFTIPISVQRPAPIVEETQEAFGWGDFPVSKRMLPIPGRGKHRRHHTIL
jgi:hypothetical protein